MQNSTVGVGEGNCMLGKKGKGVKLHHFRGKPYPNLSLIITFKDKSRLPTL